MREPGPQHTVAIIGAGIAGLLSARKLCGAGVGVTIFEKSGDIGGRMATRTLGNLAFDHGVPSFDFNAPAFSEVATSWRAAVASLGPAYVGIPNMKAPARILASGLTIITGQTVMSFARQANGWALTLSTGERTGQFSAILLAIPSPQAAAICRDQSVFTTRSRCGRLSTVLDADAGSRRRTVG